MQTILEARDIRKNFGPVQALRGVSFACTAGEVHGIVGENGAGKSTLVKILSGVITPDAGEVVVHGARYFPRSPRDAARMGIATVFQELPVVPHLSAARNLFLGAEPAGALGVVQERVVQRQAAEVLASYDVEDVPLDVEAGSLPLPLKQKLLIVKALVQHPKILILDEPTSALSSNDVDWLFEKIRAAVAGGTTVIVISHRLAEIRQVCHRLTVLRDGLAVGSFQVSEVTDADIVQYMLGRTLAQAFPGPTRAATRDDDVPVLETRNLSGRAFHEVTFSLSRGEILGIAALQGQGQRELFLALFGEEPIEAGEVRVEGRPVRLRSPRDAIRHGIGLVPEDRKTEGLFLELSGRENVVLPALSRFAIGGVVQRRREWDEVRRFLERARVDVSALYRPAKAFSGGNQQKMLFAKWLLPRSKILLLYDPTRGVDVGAKAEIFSLMRELANDGVGLLFYSTELEELANVPDRIVVMYKGRIVSEIKRRDVKEDVLLANMIGLSDEKEKAVSRGG